MDLVFVIQKREKWNWNLEGKRHASGQRKENGDLSSESDPNPAPNHQPRERERERKQQCSFWREKQPADDKKQNTETESV